MKTKKAKPLGAKKLLWSADYKTKTGYKVEFSVYKSDDFTRTQPLLAFCEEFNLTAGASDVNVLRSKMEALIEDHVSFTWEPWLQITVREFENGSSMFTNSCDRCELMIEVEQFECAERDGKAFHRRRGEHRACEGRLETHGRVLNSRHGGIVRGEEFSTRSLIRDTPEARAALEHLQANMNALAARVATMLSQDNLIASLKRLAAGSSPLLPAAGENE